MMQKYLVLTIIELTVRIKVTKAAQIEGLCNEWVATNKRKKIKTERLYSDYICG